MERSFDFVLVQAVLLLLSSARGRGEVLEKVLPLFVYQILFQTQEFIEQCQSLLNILSDCGISHSVTKLLSLLFPSDKDILSDHSAALVTHNIAVSLIGSGVPQLQNLR